MNTIKNLLWRIKGFVQRQWRMIAVVCAVFFIGTAIGRFSVHPYTEIIHHELSQYDSGTWVAKIDGDAIGASYLERRLEVYNSINPDDAQKNPFMKDIMLKKLIDNYIILKEIYRSGMYKNTNMQEFVWYYTEEAMVSYYLDFINRMKAGKEIHLSDADMEKFYLQKKSLFDAQGKTKEESMKIIQHQLVILNETLYGKNREMNRRIELGALKKDKKIEINTKALAR